MPTKLRTHLSRVMLTDLTDHANPRSNAATTATTGSGCLKLKHQCLAGSELASQASCILLCTKTVTIPRTVSYAVILSANNMCLENLMSQYHRRSIEFRRSGIWHCLHVGTQEPFIAALLEANANAAKVNNKHCCILYKFYKRVPQT